MSEITFQFTPTPQDYTKSLRSFYWMTERRTWIGLGIFALLTSAMFLSALIRGDLGDGGWGLGVFYLILPLMFVFFLVISPYLTSRQVAQNPRLRSPTTWTVGEEGILIRDEFIETRLDWGFFQRVIETPEHFLFIHSANRRFFNIVPRRAFTSPVQENVFRELWARKVHPAPASKSGLSPRLIFYLVLAALVVIVAVVSYFQALNY